MRGEGIQPRAVWTIGHSTLPIEQFVQALQRCQITLLADVRRFPGSRRHPQYGSDRLRAELSIHRIRYEHLPELGGRRRARKDSPHTSWRVEAFRGYADYMDTPPFAEGIARLLQLAAADRVAVMCAERVWWSCHRALIADYLKSTGHEVIHILTADRQEPHPYTAAARIVDGRLSYRGLV
jgi:uncharacterized protein (DUF488 family)